MGGRFEITQCQAKMAALDSFSYICTRALHAFQSFAHCRAASTVIPLLPNATFTPSIQPNTYTIHTQYYIYTVQYICRTIHTRHNTYAVLQIHSIIYYAASLSTDAWHTCHAAHRTIQHNSVCDRALLGFRLYPGRMWGVESEMGVWLDGEGVGQGTNYDENWALEMYLNVCVCNEFWAARNGQIVKFWIFQAQPASVRVISSIFYL